MSKFSRRGSFSVEYLLLAMAIIGVAVFLLSNYLSKLSSPVTGATSFTIQNYRVADNFMAITIKNMGSVAITKTEITIAGKTCSIDLGRVYKDKKLQLHHLKKVGVIGEYVFQVVDVGINGVTYLILNQVMSIHYR